MAVSEEALRRAGLNATESADFLEFLYNNAQRTLKSQAREIAKTMVMENGKYHKAYQVLEDQLTALWDKALVEANAQVGLAEVQ